MSNSSLIKRIKLYSKRLFSDIYDSPVVFSGSPDWPGDFPGRTLLALSSLYLLDDKMMVDKGTVEKKLESFFKYVGEYVNSDHYFGPLFNATGINEQQLSGNSWYIRGLCRCLEIKKDEKIINWLKTIKERFLIPLSYEYENYPIKDRNADGGVSGHISSKIGKWTLSSDVGCAFILLDGYVSIYEMDKDPRLKKAIERIIAEYKKIDFVNSRCQTHATLTCARAILRFYLATKEREYLDLAIDIFGKYRRIGMSDDYQNANWFLRNDTWTEPCCVIDSLILAKWLYIITKKEEYIKLFNLIYANGFRTFQRDNGGAGCSTVAKDGNKIIKSTMYEAFFCCSLREGEGFYELSNSIIKEGNKRILMIPDDYEDDNMKTAIDLYGNKIFNLEFKKETDVSIYVPDGFKSRFDSHGNLLNFHGKARTIIDIEFDLSIRKEGYRYLYGDMLLSKKEKHMDNVFMIEGQKYSYIYDSSSFSEEDICELIQEL